MYKTITIIALVFIVGFSNVVHSFKTPSKNLQRLDEVKNVGLDLCPWCIDEAVADINVILNVILDEGILGDCDKLCNAVANKTHSAALGVICNLACDAVGIDEFIHLIITVDLDPIWYCEIAHLCPSKKTKEHAKNRI